MATNLGPAILGVCVTVLLAVIALFFRAGHLAARVEELERWRGTIRVDMREISDILERLGRQLTTVETLIRERTERREHERHIE
jgi:DNA anti-recombination protein RmuC